jgi:hypothetical protein
MGRPEEDRKRRRNTGNNNGWNLSKVNERHRTRAPNASGRLSMINNKN